MIYDLLDRLSPRTSSANRSRTSEAGTDATCDSKSMFPTPIIRRERSSGWLSCRTLARISRPPKPR
jgi:hypothetical protein